MEDLLSIDRKDAFLVFKAERTLICSFSVVLTIVDLTILNHDVVGNAGGWLAMAVGVFAVMTQSALMNVD